MDVKAGDESQIAKIPNEPNFAANKKKIKQIIWYLTKPIRLLDRWVCRRSDGWWRSVLGVA